MKEIRLHGRGGQGAVMAAEMLVSAFYLEGKVASAFPMFGFERRGAPVSAFVRFDDKPIREKTKIYSPDCLIVLDPPQVKSPLIYTGLKADGVLVANYPRLPEGKISGNVKRLGAVNATQIALEEIGIPAFNSCMMGAFAATTKWVKLEFILSALEKYFRGEMLKKNLRSTERGFHEVKVAEL